VSALTGLLALITRDTVAIETPACSATALIEMGLPLRAWAAA
jgi:hypothetical protein